MAEKTVTPAPWSITQEDLDSITQHETIVGISRLFPPVAEIPKEFWAGNVYTKIAEALYIGEVPEEVQIEWLPGFDNPESLAHMCKSHIRAFGPQYEEKIAGLGYMIAQVIRVTPLP